MIDQNRNRTTIGRKCSVTDAFVPFAKFDVVTLLSGDAGSGLVCEYKTSLVLRTSRAAKSFHDQRNVFLRMSLLPDNNFCYPQELNFRSKNFEISFLFFSV